MADRTAWIERGRRRRRGSPGSQFPRRRLVGDAQIRHSGVVSTRVWVGWPLRGMRKPLEARAGLGRAWAGLATARGGLRGGASPACSVRGARASYRLRFLAQTTREALGGSPRSETGRSCSGAGPTSRSGGGGGVVVADWSQGCVFGLPSPADRRAGSLRRGQGGQAGWRCVGDVKSRRRSSLPETASGSNSGKCRPGSRVACSGLVPGNTAKTLRRPWELSVQRGGVLAAEQRRGTAGVSGVGFSGSQLWNGRRRGPWDANYRPTGILGRRARRGRRGDCGRALLCGESGSRNRISVIRLGVIPLW